jgi:hypothetical protein
VRLDEASEEFGSDEKATRTGESEAAPLTGQRGLHKANVRDRDHRAEINDM